MAKPALLKKNDPYPREVAMLYCGKRPLIVARAVEHFQRVWQQVRDGVQ